jgi:hypothetical protein
MSWGALHQASPEIAEFGKERFATGVAYPATIKPNEAPRLHPVTPKVGGDRLFLFMEPTTPKGHDLH